MKSTGKIILAGVAILLLAALVMYARQPGSGGLPGAEGDKATVTEYLVPRYVSVVLKFASEDDSRTPTGQPFKAVGKISALIGPMNDIEIDFETSKNIKVLSKSTPFKGSLEQGKEMLFEIEVVRESVSDGGWISLWIDHTVPTGDLLEYVAVHPEQYSNPPERAMLLATIREQTDERTTLTGKLSID